MAISRAYVPAIISITLLLVPILANGDTPQDYLDPHNEARSEVGVPSLTWSSTLASYARSYAETQAPRCIPLTHSHGPYGENLFWGSSGKDWAPGEAVQAWTAEAENYDYGGNSCSAGKMCGHYTQVVWASTTHVGCASVHCDDGAEYVICSYDPPGNWIGERPF